MHVPDCDGQHHEYGEKKHAWGTSGLVLIESNMPSVNTASSRNVKRTNTQKQTEAVLANTQIKCEIFVYLTASKVSFASKPNTNLTN